MTSAKPLVAQKKREIGQRQQAKQRQAEDYIRHWREMMLGGLAVRPVGGGTPPSETGPRQGDER